MVEAMNYFYLTQDVQNMAHKKLYLLEFIPYKMYAPKKQKRYISLIHGG